MPDDPFPNDPHPDTPGLRRCPLGEPLPCQRVIEDCDCFQEYIAEFMAGNV